MISILVELSRKIISKKKPFDSFIVLLLCYLFVEVYYATIKRSGSLAAITRGNKSNLSSVCEDIDKDWSSESNRDWVFNSSLPFPVTRIPALYKDLTQIPKIIHQTWKSKDNIPHQFQIWSDTCKILHPKWEYRLWDDSDNLQFVQDHFDWFLETYNGFPFDISRVDAIRYMVLYKIGGFFFDLDMECLTPLDPFVSSGIILSRLSDDPKIGFPEHIAPNSWLGSAPGHPFWLFLLQKMVSQYLDGKSVQVESIGGSIFLHDALLEWRDMALDIKLPVIQYLHHGRIYGYDWRIKGDEMKVCSAQDDQFNPTLCKQLIPKNSVMITYYSKLWGNWMMQEKMEKSDFH